MAMRYLLQFAAEVAVEVLKEVVLDRLAGKGGKRR
jgi:hypothetical protein